MNQRAYLTHYRMHCILARFYRHHRLDSLMPERCAIIRKQRHKMATTQPFVRSYRKGKNGSEIGRFVR